MLCVEAGVLKVWKECVLEKVKNRLWPLSLLRSEGATGGGAGNLVEMIL